MKLTFLALLLGAAFAVPAAYGQAARNPMLPSGPGPAATSKAAPPLPDARPGSYIAGKRPLIPLPPPGMPKLVLPPAAEDLPLAPITSSPPVKATGGVAAETMSPVPVKPASEPKSSDSAPGAGADVASAAAEKKNKAAQKAAANVFLSREVLQASRAKCNVQLKSPTVLTFPTAGGRKTLRMTVTGGRSCVKAISSSHDWIQVSDLVNDELTVNLAENEDSQAREGMVVIANTGSSVKVVVRQEPNESGFRRIEL